MEESGPVWSLTTSDPLIFDTNLVVSRTCACPHAGMALKHNQCMKLFTNHPLSCQLVTHIFSTHVSYKLNWAWDLILLILHTGSDLLWCNFQARSHRGHGGGNAFPKIFQNLFNKRSLFFAIQVQGERMEISHYVEPLKKAKGGTRSHTNRSPTLMCPPPQEIG